MRCPLEDEAAEAGRRLFDSDGVLAPDRTEDMVAAIFQKRMRGVIEDE